MTAAALLFGATLAAFSSSDHGWQRSSPDLLRAVSTPEGLAISFSGKDPHLSSPQMIFPTPGNRRSRAVFTLETAPSDDVDEYQLFYAFGNAPFAEHEKLMLRPAEKSPPYSHFRAELEAPDYRPGEPVRFRLDPSPGKIRTAVLRSLDLSFRAPVWTPEFLSPPPFRCEGKRYALDGSGWRLVQDGTRPWVWALEAEGRIVAESPGDESVVCMDASGALRSLVWRPEDCTVYQERGCLRVVATSRDGDGAVWTFSRQFVAAGDGALEVRTELSVDRAARLVHMPYLTVLADRASRGRKTQALLPGVEYLADEPSSSETELRGRDARRIMPEAWKVCYPLMLLVRSSGDVSRTLSLSWSREKGAVRSASAVFDTPDRVYSSGGHLFALWAPAVDFGREPNDLSVYESRPFTGGSVVARLSLGRERSVGEALGRIVKMSDLPPPQEVPCAAFVDRVAPGWLGGHLGEGGKWGYPHRVVSDVAPFLSWVSAHSTGDAQKDAFNVKWRETLEACPSNSTECLGWGGKLFRWSRPAGPFMQRTVRRRQIEQEGHLSRMVEAWKAGYLVYRPAKGKPDYSVGLGASDVNGYTATFMHALMDTAAWSGDERRVASALDIVRRTKDHYAGTVPRGAQCWEMPLHTPDILASALMAETFARAYQMSGDAEFLDAAREWAQAGMAFVYLEEPHAEHPPSVTDPYGLYATTAVFGASDWTLTNWIGRPVQWCGLVYARALQCLAGVEPDAARAAFWRRLASGIAFSGLKQCYTAAEPPYDGLLPDSFDPPSQRRYLGALATCSLVEAMGEIYGAPIHSLLRPYADRPYLVQAPGALKAIAADDGELLRLEVNAWPERDFEMLVTRIERPSSVLLGDLTLPFDWRDMTLVVKLPPCANGVLRIVR